MHVCVEWRTIVNFCTQLPHEGSVNCHFLHVPRVLGHGECQQDAILQEHLCSCLGMLVGVGIHCSGNRLHEGVHILLCMLYTCVFMYSIQNYVQECSIRTAKSGLLLLHVYNFATLPYLIA